jgi:hypothetical protein
LHFNALFVLEDLKESVGIPKNQDDYNEGSYDNCPTCKISSFGKLHL